jgi:hypothetical protein
MQKRALIVVDSDPRRSHRPAEAVRLAAGLSGWMPERLAICLMGSAAGLLGDGADLLGEEDLQVSWPVLRDAGTAVYTDFPPAPGTRPQFLGAVREIDAAGVARLAAGVDCLLRF